MENTNQQLPTTPTEPNQEPNPVILPPKSKRMITIIAVIIVLILVGAGTFVLIMSKKQSSSQYNQQSTGAVSPMVSRTPEASSNDFFYFSIPKPISNLTVQELPNDANPKNVVKYNDSLWFAGDGSIVEYDIKTGKLVSYSKPDKGNCTGNIVMASGFLFTSCSMKNISGLSSDYVGKPDWDARYAIFKINPSTHAVEHMFTPKDGLLNTSNYYLYPDGNTVWVVTEGGVGKIDSKTNQVKFYANELGIPGSILSIRTMLVDQDYVWIAVNANVGSQGGLAMYDKKNQTWKAFNVRDLKDYSLDRFDLEAGFKTIPGGIQIAFRDGNLDTSDRLVEKQYIYQTGKWTKVNIDRPASGAQSEKTRQYVLSTYPSTFNYKKVDQFGLTQLQLPDSNQVYQLDGRDSYILSPMIGNKRYVLSSATVDVIDDSSPFRQILVKLGERLEGGVLYADPSAYQGLVQFLVDPDSSLAVVTDSACGGQGCTGNQKAWFIDLNAGKINKVYTAKSDNLPSGELLTELNMSREGSLLVIKDKNSKPLFNIDTTSYSLSLPQK